MSDNLKARCVDFFFPLKLLSFFQLFLPKVVVMYLLGILALGFYALKIPERYFPGNCQQQAIQVYLHALRA